MITALDMAPAAVPGPAIAPGRGAKAFAAVLAGAGEAVDRAQLRDAATELVASSLIQPILSRMRESPFLEGPFAPGHAEKQFAPLLDQHMAERIAGGADLPLVGVIVERFAGPAPAQPEHRDG